MALSVSEHGSGGIFEDEAVRILSTPHAVSPPCSCRLDVGGVPGLQELLLPVVVVLSVIVAATLLEFPVTR